MKLSTRRRYALRAMLEFALNYGKGPLSLKNIARKKNSARYLGHTINNLLSAGLVQSRRGSYGGFSLAKLPEEIKLSQIIQVAEGLISLVVCVDSSKLCNRVDACVTYDIWKKAKKAMVEAFDSVTLEYG